MRGGSTQIGKVGEAASRGPDRWLRQQPVCLSPPPSFSLNHLVLFCLPDLGPSTQHCVHLEMDLHKFISLSCVTLLSFQRQSLTSYWQLFCLEEDDLTRYSNIGKEDLSPKSFSNNFSETKQKHVFYPISQVLACQGIWLLTGPVDLLLLAFNFSAWTSLAPPTQYITGVGGGGDSFRKKGSSKYFASIWKGTKTRWPFETGGVVTICDSNTLKSYQ